MSDDWRYHETRAAQERAMAFSYADGEVRRRHMEVADHHADRARAIRGGLTLPPQSIADDGISAAIKNSRDLIRDSQRILAESRSNVPTRR